jgi:hypothetical protein
VINVSRLLQVKVISLLAHKAHLRSPSNFRGLPYLAKSKCCQIADARFDMVVGYIARQGIEPVNRNKTSHTFFQSYRVGDGASTLDNWKTNQRLVPTPARRDPTPDANHL